MGIGDFADEAKDLAADHKDKVKDGIDEAGDMVDEKTEGKYSEQIDKGEKAAKGYVDDLDEDDQG